MLLFLYKVLKLIPQNKDPNKPSLTNVIRNNIAEQSCTPASDSKSSRRRAKCSGDVLRRRVELRIDDGDITGAVRTLASEDVIADQIAETLSTLRGNIRAAARIGLVK